MKSSFSNALALAEQVKDNNNTFDVEFVVVPFGFSNDTTIVVSDKEIKDFYNKNKEQFKQIASRDIEYIVVDIVPSSDDVVAANNAIAALYEDFQNAENMRNFLLSKSERQLDKKWYKEIVEMEVLQMPVHGGGTKEIEVDYKFAGLEDEVSYISTEDFLRSMFSPFKAQWKKRIEEAGDNQQYIYEIVNPNYEKPIILRNMPFLSNHLSRFDGVIGVYLTLNKDLNPAIQIRFAEPMTAEKIWELITMEIWTITYKKDDVREEGAKISFKEQGVVYPFNE